MLYQWIPEKDKETFYNHMIRPDMPGFGPVIDRYQNNGYHDITEYETYKDCRCGFYLGNYDNDVVINRPCIVTLTSDFDNHLFIKAERTIIYGANYKAKNISIFTDDDSFMETGTCVGKVMFIDLAIDNLDIKDSINIAFINTTVKSKNIVNTTSIVEVID